MELLKRSEAHLLSKTFDKKVWHYKTILLYDLFVSFLLQPEEKWFHTSTTTHQNISWAKHIKQKWWKKVTLERKEKILQVLNRKLLLNFIIFCSGIHTFEVLSSTVLHDVDFKYLRRILNGILNKIKWLTWCIYFTVRTTLQIAYISSLLFGGNGEISFRSTERLLFSNGNIKQKVLF